MFTFSLPRKNRKCKGLIKVFTGPMASGKSEAMMKELTIFERSNIGVQVFRPLVDTRTPALIIDSRTGYSFPAIPVKNAREVIKKNLIREDTSVVAFDEPHMMALGFTQTCINLKLMGYKVWVSGLNLDFRGQPIKPMDTLLCYADTVTYMKEAYCSDCGGVGEYSHRTVDSEEMILPGGLNIYKTLCDKCWVEANRG